MELLIKWLNLAGTGTTIGNSSISDDGTSVATSLTFQAVRFASGGAVYPNVAYGIRGTITGNSDTWGVYAGAQLRIAPTGGFYVG